MADNVVLPELSESVTEATVTRWLKAVGETVAVDEPLLEVSTDKVDSEVPSPFACVLEQIVAGEDAVVTVGQVLAVIGDGSGVGSQPAAAVPEVAAEPTSVAPAAPAAPAPAAPPAAAAPPPPAPSPAPAPADGKPYATPLVHKIAANEGVDLVTVAGTGVGGRVRRGFKSVAAEGRLQSAARW